MVGFVTALPAERIVILAGSLFAIGSVGSLGLYALYARIRKAHVRARIVGLLDEGEAIINRRQVMDSHSYARAIDEWRARVGRLPQAIHRHVLGGLAGQAGDLITQPLLRLSGVSENLSQWLD